MTIEKPYNFADVKRLLHNYHLEKQSAGGYLIFEVLTLTQHFVAVATKLPLQLYTQINDSCFSINV